MNDVIEQEQILPQFDINDISPEVNDETVSEFSVEFNRLAKMITSDLPECRQRSLALTELENAYLWVKQTIALNQDVL